jgi:cytochrome c oxidase subunit 2
MDLIPGRVNELVLEPTKTGVYRGQCAELCGESHALMAFSAVVMEPDDFRAWLAHAAEPAKSPPAGLAEKGKEVFLETGCGACHAVRGTEAEGQIGPDLTHVGSRKTLGAGILPNTRGAFARWISATREIKPAVRMPSFHMLPEDELQALAAYLESLQ